MSRSAFNLITSRLSCAISSCSGFICPGPGKACCGSSPNALTQLRSCVGCTPRSADACAYDTPRSLIRRTASSLNSRVYCRLSMTHLLLHKTPNSVSSEPGAAQQTQSACPLLFVVAIALALYTPGRHAFVKRLLALDVIALIGVTGLWTGVSHVFFPATAAAHIGWQASPFFQFEVGTANFAI